MNKPAWMSRLRPFEKPDTRKSVVQILTSLVPYVGVVTAMYLLLHFNVSYWFVLPLAVLGGGFLVRTFIILHDCSHGSFFKSRRACAVWGHICGVVTFTPFSQWRRSHLTHHATVANLEKRYSGDVWTMTVEEYRTASPLLRLGYRVFRNPVVLFGIGPAVLFLIFHRLPRKDDPGRHLLNVLLLDAFLAALIIAAHWTVGIVNFLAVQGPIVFLAGLGGVWLFYVQHQFEDVYWSRSSQWDPVAAALMGSSYYKLPAIFRWFSGNIGFHHIHHLKSGIPNYNLKPCHDQVAELHEIPTITLMTGFKSLFLHLWDEESGKLVSFSAARRKFKDL